MAVSTSIQIAGIDFILSFQDSIVLDKLPEAYRHFIKSTDSENGSTSVNIDLKINNLPDTDHLKKIFDSDQSWSMFMNEDEYFLTLSPPALDKKAVWLARFHRSFDKATIYCSEMLMREVNGETKLGNPFSYPLDQLLLMYILSRRDGIIIHAAGIILNERGYIFAGKSGAGKSTLSKEFVLRNNSEVLSDDRIVVRKINNLFQAYGTPWQGEAEMAMNKGVPLSGIFFLSHGSYNRIEEIKPQEALEKLLPVVSIPWYDKEVMISILTFCGDIISNIPVYELFFKPDREIIDVFEKFLSK